MIIKWLNKLQRKYGKFAIPNLMKHIVILTAIVYFFAYLVEIPNLINYLTLHPWAVRQGQIWRLITYIAIPPSRSPIFIIFVLYFYYMVGTGLEQAWGSFKFNVYYFIGMLATTIAAFVSGAPATATYLNLSLFLAFAKIYPDYEILLFLILPIKVKYLAIFNWIIIALTILFLPHGRISASMAVLNYFIFFGKRIIRDLKRKKRVYSNRKDFKGGLNKSDSGPIHQCTVCGITEKDDSDMQFRYCSKCEGAYEYCMDHLDDHQHISED